MWPMSLLSVFVVFFDNELNCFAQVSDVAHWSLVRFDDASLGVEMLIRTFKRSFVVQFFPKSITNTNLKFVAFVVLKLLPLCFYF